MENEEKDRVHLHSWNLTPEEACRIQSELRERLILAWDDHPIAAIAGVDVSIRPIPSAGPGAGAARCAIVVLRFPELEPVEASLAEAPLTFPYIPGLLAFREGPVILAAWEKLDRKPDLIMFDGQGIAHPRGLGIASQMGLWLERPSIGVAKSRLYGHHVEPRPERGAWADLLDEQSRVIGAVLRTKSGVKPLYVSPGHRIDLAHAVEFVLACSRGYRLPETTRLAHRIAGGEPLAPRDDCQPRLF